LVIGANSRSSAARAVVKRNLGLRQQKNLFENAKSGFRQQKNLFGNAKSGSRQRKNLFGNAKLGLRQPVLSSMADILRIKKLAANLV
jgi:hypothetical protein